MTVQPDRLRFARSFLGFTREDVAKAVGTDSLALEDMEMGRAEPTDAMLAKFGKLYRRPPAWFRGETAFTPSDDLLRMMERKELPEGDREALLDFAEWLQHAGSPDAPLRSRQVKT